MASHSIVSRSVLCLTVIWCVGCATTRSANTDSDGQGMDRIREIKLVEEDLILQEVDLDGNGTADVFNYFRERSAASRLLVRKKIDLDFDGRVDVISTFDEDGALATEQMDGDFDGQIDWTDHYQNGVRVMAEADSNYDGQSDIFFYYSVAGDGRPRIERKERDTDGDGRIDFWERFDERGVVVRTGRDTDGDGKMDERDE